jgi:hypothetical protein
VGPVTVVTGRGQGVTIATDQMATLSGFADGGGGAAPLGRPAPMSAIPQTSRASRPGSDAQCVLESAGRAAYVGFSVWRS